MSELSPGNYDFRVGNELSSKILSPSISSRGLLSAAYHRAETLRKNHTAIPGFSDVAFFEDRTVFHFGSSMLSVMRGNLAGQEVKAVFVDLPHTRIELHPDGSSHGVGPDWSSHHRLDTAGELAGTDHAPVVDMITGMYYLSGLAIDSFDSNLDDL